MFRSQSQSHLTFKMREKVSRHFALITGSRQCTYILLFGAFLRLVTHSRDSLLNHETHNYL